MLESRQTVAAPPDALYIGVTPAEYRKQFARITAA
jgi:hypothetical protein